MRLLIPTAICCCAIAAPSVADVATFDSFPEGMFALTITDHGIRFANLDQRLPGNPVAGHFAIDNAANMLWREAGFTAPNALGFGTFSPGLPVTFGRVGSFDIFPERPAARIALHFFQYGTFPGCTINLTVSRNATTVGQINIPASEGEGLHHHVLDYDGPIFDRAHLSIGPTSTSYIFALVDTVTIDDALPCRADWDDSGTLDSTDFFAFLADFFAADADFNDDKRTDSRDFFDFLTNFFTGCW